MSTIEKIIQEKLDNDSLRMFKYCLRVPNVTTFRSTIARFPDNWGFGFHILYNGEKIAKNQKFKILKIPREIFWGPLGGKTNSWRGHLLKNTWGPILTKT